MSEQLLELLSRRQLLRRASALGLAAMVAEVESILKGPGIQARCLECPPVAPAHVEQKDLTLLAMIRSWFS